jgi:diamine N-acetyltransferase
MEFRELDMDNWLECARLWTEEDRFIAPNLYSIAEAQFYPKAVSRAIYDGGRMVGYVLHGGDEDREDWYIIDRLMIAAPFRRKGLASEAIAAIVALAAADGRYRVVRSSTEPDNAAMRRTFEGNGFRTEDEMDGDEIVYFRGL